MQKKSQTELNSIAINTGSNFFNSSQDQLNKMLSQGQGKLPINSGIDQIINFSQSEDVNKVVEDRNIDKLELPVRPRYGNHRNKTTRGFQRANLKQAVHQCQKQSNRFYKGQSAPLQPPEKYFSMYSPGIFLFFSFLKRISILFLVLSFVYLCPLIYNYLNGTYFQYSASTFQVGVAKMMIGNQVYQTDNASQNLKDKLFIMIPDGLAAVIFSCFFIYWGLFSDKVNNEYKHNFHRVSDSTIEITEFPGDLSEREVEQYFQKYGQICEVAAVKNYEQMIDLSKQVYDLSLQIKQKIIVEASLGKQQTKEHKQYLQKNENTVSNLLEELSALEQKREKKNIKFYVRFEEEEARQKVLQEYKPYSGWCKCCVGKIPEELLIKGMFPKIKACQTEPAEIVWQNTHIKRKSRWGRFILQFILVAVIIAIGFLVITIMNISTPPTSYNNIQTQSMSLSQIKANQTFSISYTWCINKPTFSSTQQQEYCQPYLSNYKIRLVLTISITLIIILIKSILKYVMIKIVYFQRYKNHTELSNNIMTNLFIIYISTTVMITFLMQANIFGISVKNVVRNFITDSGLLDNLGQIKEYQDFMQDWYKDIGYQIWLNWLILSIFPHPLMPLFLFIRQKIYYRLAKKQILQKNVISYIQPEQFEIEDHYANILMLIFVGLIFSGGMPFLPILTFVGLVTRYWVFKYIFVRYCRIPKYYTDAMNNRAQLILQITIVLHVALSIWMFAVGNIFGQGDHLHFMNIDTSSDNGWIFILKKLTANWYFTLLLAVVLTFLLLNRLIIEVIKKLCHDEKQQQQNNNNLKKTQVSLTQSYKIENNPNYFQILAIMKPQQVRISDNLQRTSKIKQMFNIIGDSTVVK